MKKQFIFLFFYIFNISIIWSQTTRQKSDYYYSNNASFKSIAFPPGTIKLNDSIYIDVVPVDNILYKEFQNSVEHFWTLRVSDSLKKIPKFGLTKAYMIQNFEWLPIDNALFDFIKFNGNQSVGSYIDMMNYNHHPKYNYYPIVNKSKEQAILFCMWRTDVVNLRLAILSKEEREKYPKTIRYRLPLTNEFNEAVALFGYSKPIKNKETPFSPYRLKYKSKYSKAVFYQDNLSEYTSEEQSFGTNWKSEKNNSATNDYTSFRCVCEVTQ